MRKFTIIALLAICAFAAKAQTYSWNGYGPIRDLETDTIPIVVNNMTAAINTTYGLAHICFDMYHSYKSDLVIKLISPDGTSVILVQGVGGNGANFLGTCVGMDGIPFANGQPPYTGTFLSTGDVNIFNNGQNPNGTWKLLVSDIAASDTGSVRSLSISFANNPPASNGTGGTNVGPAGPFVCPTCVCPGGAAGCDLLPDMTASGREILVNHNEVAGALYISNATPNIGYGPIEIYGIDSCFCDGVPVPCNTTCPNGGELQHIVRQRIYRKVPGTDTLAYYDRTAGAMTYHPEHGHLHVDGWANYTLRTATANPDPRTWPIVGTGVKQSFCLINLGTCAGRPGECLANNGDTILTVPNNNFGFQSGCGLNQGIYPGNYDVYNVSLNDPIPLNNVCNGNYFIVSITDPNNDFLESDETNNVVVVPITLTRQNVAPTISASSSTVLCQGDSVVLTASTASNYLWSTGATTQTTVVRAAGTYTVSTNCGTTTSTSTPITVSILPAGSQPAVSIAITFGGNPSCLNTPITFTPSPTNGGNNPVYEWRINNVISGTGANFTTRNLLNGDVVTCKLTSEIACFANSPVISNSITVAVNPVGNPAITLAQTKGSNPQCLGDTATFTATVTNGTNIRYQWKINGSNVGTNSNTFTTSNLTNGQTVRCDVSAIPVCPSKAIIGTGTGLNSSSSCIGAAYPSYYGNGRQQYLIRAGELSALGLTAGNITSVSFTVGGTLGDPQILNGYTIKMAATTATVMDTVFLSPNFTTVFAPSNYRPVLNAVNTHNFSTPFYWDGTSNVLMDICFESGLYGRMGYQTYQTLAPFSSTCYYQKDSTEGIGACSKLLGSKTFYRPNMTFTSSGIKNISSETVTMSINSATPPSVSIDFSTGENLQCANTPATLRATPNNTGANPSYQWTKNGITLNGATSNTYSSGSLNHNDTLSCMMTSGGTCGTLQNVMSNQIIIKIPEPVYTFTGNGNWNIPANWSNNLVPPAKLLYCSQIIVNPSAGGECILNVPQTIAPASRITVATGKKFRVLSNLLIVQ